MRFDRSLLMRTDFGIVKGLDWLCRGLGEQLLDPVLFLGDSMLFDSFDEFLLC